MKAAKHVAGLLLMTLLLISGVSAHADTRQQLPLPLDSRVGHHEFDAILQASRAGDFYQIQSAASEVRFSVDTMANTVKGKFVHFKGGIAFQPHAHNNGQAFFVVKSDSISTSNTVIDKVVRSKSFFDVESYPDILFVSSSLLWLSETRGVLKGKLTIRGITKAIVFNVGLSDIQGNRIGNSDTILFNVDTSISRSMFGMKLMSSVVGDTVKLSMTIHAKKQSGVTKEQLVALASSSGF